MVRPVIKLILSVLLCFRVNPLHNETGQGRISLVKDQLELCIRGHSSVT